MEDAATTGMILSAGIALSTIPPSSSEATCCSIVCQLLERSYTLSMPSISLSLRNDGPNHKWLVLFNNFRVGISVQSACFQNYGA